MTSNLDTEQDVDGQRVHFSNNKLMWPKSRPWLTHGAKHTAIHHIKQTLFRPFHSPHLHLKSNFSTIRYFGHAQTRQIFLFSKADDHTPKFNRRGMESRCQGVFLSFIIWSHDLSGCSFKTSTSNTTHSYPSTRVHAVESLSS